MKLAESFQSMRSVFGFCPCCGDVFRLSEATIFVKAPPPKTTFDQLDDSRDRLARAVERFEEREQELRRLSREKGQQAASQRLRKIAPFFARRRIEPKDVKVLFHPVEYVAFPGMADGDCHGIELIDRPPSDRARERIHGSIASCIKAGNLEWRTYRIEDDGRVSDT